MSALLVLVPSRGRPGNAVRLAEAFHATRTADSALMFGLDEDDPALEEYLRVLAGRDVLVAVGPRLRLGGTLNALAKREAAAHDVLGFMGDDHAPRSHGWDTRILEVLTEPGYAYGDDLLVHEALPTAVFVSSVIVRTLGFFQPPNLTHMYFDNFWLDFGRALGRITYCPDVVIEHMHYLAGKSLEDARYREVNAPEMYARDGEAYRRYLDEDFDIDVERVRAALNG